MSQLQIDGRSPAAYGLAYIFATLSVTNRELRALVLAEKDISVEQYEKIMDLQRIKAKDEAGDPLEEPKVRLLLRLREIQQFDSFPCVM